MLALVSGLFGALLSLLAGLTGASFNAQIFKS
jgi:hypothetical protein